MMKNLILGLAILVSITSFIFAYIRSNEAEMAQVEVIELKLVIEEMLIEADRLREQAVEATAHAKMAEAEAHRAVEECQSKLDN